MIIVNIQETSADLTLLILYEPFQICKKQLTIDKGNRKVITTVACFLWVMLSRTLGKVDPKSVCGILNENE